MRTVLIVVALLLAGPALAGEPRTLTVVNDTSAAVNQLFVVGQKAGKLRARVSGILGATDGDRDRLDARMLPRGGSIEIALKGERCRYDVRAVLEDGRTYVADDLDVCVRSRWAISQGARQ